MKTSSQTEGAQGFSDNTEPYGKGGYENASQGRHDYPSQDVEGVQDSSRLSEEADKEGKGGVKGWISSKLLGGSKAEHKHEDQALGGEHGFYEGAGSGEGINTRSGEGEPTTDSGEAVRSVSDGPARSFNIRPLADGEGADYGDGTDSSESQRL